MKHQTVYLFVVSAALYCIAFEKIKNISLCIQRVMQEPRSHNCRIGTNQSQQHNSLQTMLQIRIPTSPHLKKNTNKKSIHQKSKQNPNTFLTNPWNLCCYHNTKQGHEKQTRDSDPSSTKTHQT